MLQVNTSTGAIVSAATAVRYSSIWTARPTGSQSTTSTLIGSAPWVTVTTSAAGAERASMASTPDTISSGSSYTPTAKGGAFPRERAPDFMMN